MKKLFFVLILMTGCQSRQSGGTTTGNPLTVNLKVTGSSLAASNVVRHRHFLPSLFLPHAWALTPPALQDSAGNSVSITEFWISLKEIELRSTQTSSGGETPDVKYSGPYAINMLDTNPSGFGDVAIQPPIRRIRAVFQKLDYSAPLAPVAMTNYAIYIAGQVNGNSFVIRSDESLTYEVSGSYGLVPASNSTLLLSLRTANVFKKINLSSVSNGMTIDNSNRVSATSPCPTVNASASDLYTCFTSALSAEANLGVDSDGNDELNSGDSTVK